MKNLVRNGTTFIIAGPVTAGDPANVGDLTGVVAVTSASGGTSVVERTGVYSLPVTATTATVTAGEAVYINGSGDLDDVTTGVLFGYADADITTIANTETKTINVVLKG